MSHPWLAGVCKLLGHRERRLRKDDFTDAGNYVYGTHADMVMASEIPITELKRLRVCDRCGRLRAVKARKAKGAT